MSASSVLQSRPIRALGIETSCDECSASVVEQSGPTARVLSLATHSQIQIHRPYGGVVPEIASRNHLETVNAMIEAWLAGEPVPYAPGAQP